MSIPSSWASQFFKPLRARRKRQLLRAQNRFQKFQKVRNKFGFESLENRRVLAATSNFLAGVLTINIDDASNIAITSNAGNVKVNGVDPTSGVLSAASLTSLVVTGSGNFANTIDLTGLNAVDFATLLNVNLDASDGGDTYLINQSLLNPLATVSVNDTGATGSDSLQLTSSSLVPETIGVSSTNITRSLAASVGYAGLESLSVSATALADTISIASTAAGTATTVNSGGGLDIFSAIGLDTIGAAGLNLNAGGNGVSLTLNTATTGTVGISSTQVTRTGNGTITYSGFSGLVVNGTTSVDTFNVASTAANCATTINAGAGVDIFGTINLMSIAAAGLTIDAGNNGESVTVDLNTAGTANISATQVMRVGNGAINYSGLGSLIVTGTASADTFSVSSTAANTATTINAGNGLDVFTNIDLTTIGNAGLTINAGGNGETLVLNTATAGTVAVSSTQVQRSGNGALGYSGLGNLLVNGTAGADTFNVASTAAATATTITTLTSLDVLTAINLANIGAAGLTIDAGGDGESLSVNAGGTTNISSTAVQQTGAGALNYNGFASLIVNGSAGSDTFNVTSTGIATTINAGGGLDVFGAIDLTSIGAAGLTINGGGDGESLTLNTTTTGTVAVSSTQVQRTGNGVLGYSGLANLIINGTVGIDTFNVSSTATNTATTINAGSGLDIISNIDLTTIGAAGLTINAGGDGESLTLNTTTAGTVAVSSTAVQRTGNGAVGVSGLATLIINGTAGIDTFNISGTPSAATTINALGGVDVFSNVALSGIGSGGLTINAGGDGESLPVNAGGTTTISSTAIQQTGAGALNYNGFASLIVNSTAGGDTFNVTSTGIATTINAAGGLDIFGAIDLTTIGAAGLTINAGGDGESLTLNTTTAGTVDLSSTQVQRSGNGAVAYSGLANLIVNGTAGIDTFNTASTAASTATTVNALAGLDVITAIDLTTIGAAGLSIDAGGDGESLTLNTGTAGTVVVSSTQVQRTGNGAVGYTGLATLIVNGTAGIDTFNVASTAAATATTINALGGLDLFGDIDLTSIGAAGLVISAGNDGESLTLNTGTAGTVAVSSTQVQRTGNGAISYSGLATLIVSGTSGVDTFNVASTATATATSINTSGGLDLFAPIDLTTIGAAGLSIDAGGNGESLTLNTTTTGTVAVSSTAVQRAGNGVVSYSGLASLIVNGTASVDTFNIASTAANTATTINALGGLDVFAAIDLTSIGASGLIIDAGSDGEALTLNTATAGTVAVSSTQVQRTGNGAVTYSGFAALAVNGTTGIDTFNVASTAASTATTINALGGLDLFGAVDLTSIGAAGLSINAGGDGESLTLNTTTAGTVNLSSTQVQRAGNGAINYSGLANLIVNGTSSIDTFNISSTAANTATAINAGSGLDVLPAIDLTSIGAAGLTISAGGDGEALTLNTATAGTVAVSSTQVQRTGNGAVAYAGLASLIINGTVGVDTFNVASTAAGTATTINALSGLDLFGTIDLTTIGAAGLSINAGSDGENLTLNTGTAGTVAVSSSQVQRSGNGAIGYTGLASLIVNGTTGIDTFNIAATAAATSTTINALGGLDLFGAIDLTSIGAAGLSINAGSDGESLTLNTTTAGTVNLSSTQVQRNGNGAVAYSGLAFLIVNGTNGIDTFNVASTATNTATTINASTGLDVFAAIDLTSIGAAGLTINAGGDGESLALNTGTPGTVAVSSTQVQRNGNGPVSYSGLANLIINGTASVDTFNVASTAASTATTINALGGLDVFGAIDLTTIGTAGLTINAGGDGESLTLNTTAAGTVNLSATQVQRSGNGAIAYSGLSSLIVDGTTSIDTFNVASTAANTATSINSLGGLDLFGAIDLTTIGGAGLTINAGGDGEALTLNTTTAGTVNVSSTQVQRSGNGPVNYNGFASLLVNGTSGIDTFNVASTALGTATTINAGGGLDVFAAIDLTTIGAAGLSIDAGGNGESLTLNTTTAGTVAVSNTQVQRNGNGAVGYAGLATLIVNGTAGVDTFNVASTATNTATTINALGGLDVFGPIDLTTVGTAGLTINAGGDGEALTLNTTTAGTVNLSATQVQHTGNGSIVYSGLASLIVNGTAGTDTFNVASTANTATTINALAGLDLFAPIDLTTIGGAGLTINVGGDGEALTLNTTAAGTVAISSTQVQRSGNGPITYAGLATLIVNGTTGVDTFNVASTADNTATTINAGGGLDLFAAIDLTTIGLAGLTIDAGGNGESLTLNTTTAGTVNLSSTQVQRIGDGAVTYSGLANLIVNGTTGVDTFNVASTAANTATTINADAGLDLFGDIALTTIGAAGLTINAGGNGEALTLNTTIAGTVGISSAAVQRSGNGALAYTGLAALTVNGTANADTFNVLSTNNATNTTINAGGGLDIFGDIDLTTIGAAGLTINAGNNGESLTLNTTTAGTVALSSTQVQRTGNGTITYSGLEHLTVNGTSGFDTFNIAGTETNTETTVNAGAGLDLFAPIDLTTIGIAGLTLNAGGDGESVTLNTTTAGTVDLSSTQVQRAGNGTVTYSGLATLTVNGTAGADTFNIASTAANTATTVNAGASLDIFAPISLTTIGAAGLTLNAGGDGEALTLNATSAGTVNVSSTTVQRNGNGPINYTGLATLNVNGTSGVDTFNIASTFVTTVTTISAGVSNDSITLGNAGSLDGLLGLLILHGEANLGSPTSSLTCGPTTNTLAVGDTLHIDDSANGAANNYTLNLATFLRSNIATVSFDGIETILLDAGTQGDTIDIAGTLAQTSLTVNGNGGADTINFAGNGAGSNVTLNGNANADILNVQSVAVSSIVLANGGSGDDTINVSSDAPANAGTLDGIVGALCIDAGTDNDKVVISDAGQLTTANSNVIVKSDRITGFAGATNASTIYYKSAGNLELTLVGSDKLVDQYRVQLSSYAKTPSLVLRFDGKSQPSGGMDRVRIDGTSANDTINVGTFASADSATKKYRFRLQNIECLQLFGSTGNDTIRNDTAVSSLIDGGDGNDTLSGGSVVDVVFGGDGKDTIFGNDGDDFIFGDHEFNNRKPQVKHKADGDILNGGNGKDTIAFLGKDTVDAGGQTGDTIIGTAKGLTPLDWLRARFLTASSKNIDAAIKEALKQPCTKI
jgi:hypothetical protein